ncbi:ATP-binding cassette domain-containing protein [Plantactinospora sp. KBS50]|uniref:ATP-binding cassette domain-containing protein n=1 Tax=Plantactinospora sp. KBS50 TaxID=2024580 RepID=UPI000BAAC054|nr:ATP-binding cassette domain-containing protein [Plantactinospora sp. KBS50]ASW55194.1 hypothetical protein CIK06_14950 [Plantactinospora sp. KBS50]
MATLRLEALVATPTLGPLTATVRPGELLAVAAAPPGGTELARVVVGLAAPVAGQILVDGRDVTTRRPHRRRLGYVPAGGGLLPHLPVGPNVRFGQRRREQVHAVTRERFDAVVAQLELGPSLHLLPHQLNEAQRFRVALARAAVGPAEVLVVDLPRPVEGADRLADLVSRIAPPDSAGVAALVCLADTMALDGMTRRVAAPAGSASR